jgi:glycerophosphoryl diester phosphodiesterase
MILIGHRGCSYPDYNQNTIRAFNKVAKEGVPAIEFDVQLCGDGQLVVVHNLDLKEVSNGKGKVSSTDSKTLKTLYAGNPDRNKDRIPFLAEVFDFFTSFPPEVRPAIHLELKGDDTGKPTGELLTKYIASGSLRYSDILVSSFNWQELRNIRKVCPALKVALIDGAVRRNLLIDKAGAEAEQYFEHIFLYGNEQYMIPCFSSLEENLELIKKECADPHINQLLAEEMEACMAGNYYTDELLDTACEMNAESVNLWHRTLTQEFIDKAHNRGLAVLVFTVNASDELLALVHMGVDGIFTDNYSESASILAPYI